MNRYNRNNLPFNKEMKESWDDNGFLIIDDFYNFNECDSLIKRAVEDIIDWSELEPILKSLEEAAIQVNHQKLRELLIKIVPQFKPQSNIVDFLFRN